MLAPDLKMEGLTYVDDIAGIGSVSAAKITLKALDKMEKEKHFTFSTSKTKILVMGRSKTADNITYQLKEGDITECTEYKYLGTWFCNKGEEISRDSYRRLS